MEVPKNSMTAAITELTVKTTLFAQYMNKLYELLEQIFELKAGQPGRGHESPIFTDLIEFQKYHKLYGDTDIKPLFINLLKKHQDFILADNFSFLEGIVILDLKVEITDKKDQSKKKKKDKIYRLNLGKFYNICLGLPGKLGIIPLTELKLSLLKIFYALSLEEKAEPNTPSVGLLKQKQETLLKLIKAKTPAPPAPKEPNSAEIGNSTSAIISGLTRGIDIDGTMKNGNIAGIVDQLTNNANTVLHDMNVNFQIPDKVKKKIANTSVSLTKVMENNPDPDNFMQIAVNSLKPTPEGSNLFEPVVELESVDKEP